jgi:predicted amidohydrolase
MKLIHMRIKDKKTEELPMAKCRVAAVQMSTVEKKSQNVENAAKYINDLMNEVYGPKPDFIVLPEMFNCPYETQNFPFYAEERGELTWKHMSQLAAHFGVYIIAGSVPEYDENDCVYNTSYVFDREGKEIACHRKVHLFDIDVKGGQSFKESETLTPGDHFTTFETEFGTMGLCICFDIRFVETYRIMAERGAKMVFVPAAFNMTTGPAHWELTHRARALDNQMYVLACAPARNEEASYVSYGHSMLTDPWGRVVASLDEKEGVLNEEVDLDYVDDIRAQLPILSARRKDLYELQEK